MRMVFFGFALLLAASASAQVVYKWTDANGGVHFGDRPPRDAAAESVAIEPPPPGAGIVPATPAVPSSGAPTRRAEPAQQPIDIVMYGRPDCGYCARARSYFAQRSIPYRELDVSRSAQARNEWRQLGGTGVPLFVINGSVSRGFSADGMTSRLRQYGW